MKNSIIAIFALFSLVTCGNSNVVHRTVLEGWQGGRLRVKHDEKLEELKLEDGSDGYLLTTKVDFSEGSDKQATDTKVWMHKDFSLVRRENRIIKNGKETSLETTTFENGVIYYTQKGGDKANVKEEVPWTKPEPPIGDIHALLYTKDITEPGGQKSYWIFYEPMRGIASDRVKRSDNTTITLAGKAYECMHYGIRSMTNPGHYNDFYVEVGTNKVLKIVIANYEFTPPGTHE